MIFGHITIFLLVFLCKNKILFWNAQVSTTSSLKWAHEMQYHVLTVTRGAVSSPLWNPLWSCRLSRVFSLCSQPICFVLWIREFHSIQIKDFQISGSHFGRLSGDWFWIHISILISDWPRWSLWLLDLFLTSGFQSGLETAPHKRVFSLFPIPLSKYFLKN